LIFLSTSLIELEVILQFYFKNHNTDSPGEQHSIIQSFEDVTVPQL